ncbi:MAG: hypothetical protein CMM30_03325 [Rhodospirillaceae bacterium]|nr:hypothetical protein [Alphaproteobacteria bacterium]MBR71958.1 hypothetical protein [Rhodospirillaceae bacterium]|tara:strand:- start:4675 stop:5010 length:336 start_codon:yes stop_codon:yes gene_type:complete
MGLIGRLRKNIKSLWTELHTMALAFTDQRTPWYVKFILICLFLYAANPIDIIPDFIPVLGMLDDIIIITIGLRIATKLTPDEVLDDCRKRALECQEKLSIPIIWKKIRENF